MLNEKNAGEDKPNLFNRFFFSLNKPRPFNAGGFFKVKASFTLTM